MRSFNQYYFILFLCFFNIFYAQDKIELELFLFDDIAYFSTEEFCLSKNYSCNKYQDKSKIVVFGNFNFNHFNLWNMHFCHRI